MDQIAISTFYRFLPLSDEQVGDIKSRLENLAAREQVRGLCLVGREGINSTVSGPLEGVERFKGEVCSALGTDSIVFKDSSAKKHPFLVFKVKVKDEIVSLGKPELVPSNPVNNHLTPREWHQAMQDPETVILDTRNDYEVDIGKFRGAVDFRLREFNEFPDKLKNSGIGKNTRVLMYCTGGIRCEKAILEAQNQGFKNVAQLDGGILNYLKEFPAQSYEGDCFVFDYRVAVNQNLEPAGKYKLCPHCGQPALQKITCVKCSREETICSRCVCEGQSTCSKNCAHHHAIGSGSNKPHLSELKKRQR